MSALIFVYAPTTFENQGIFPVRRFDPALKTPWTSELDALKKQSSGTLEVGIYGIISDDDQPPELRAVGAEPSASSYDIVLLKGKDPWLQFVKTAGVLERIRALIPAERDRELNEFMLARGD